jgi:hypothetical protein
MSILTAERHYSFHFASLNIQVVEASAQVPPLGVHFGAVALSGFCHQMTLISLKIFW